MGAKKKVIAIGDSLALPGHGNGYEDTWIKKVKTRFPAWDFITVFRRSTTTNVLVQSGGGGDNSKTPRGSDCLEYYQPNIVITNLGIVDCAPRLFYSIENKVVKHMPGSLRKPYIKLMKRIRSKSPKKAYVSIGKFEHNWTTYLSRCEAINVEKVIIIGIPHPDENMVKLNPGIVKSVKAYNEVYEGLSRKFNFVSLIYPLDSTRYDFTIFDDGYHPNPSGNELVSNELELILASHA
ncbi:SGNH/GDSL hydrolase family protein [Lewinella sp. 4G2]|uniref:SGNH/GDSL hydrolase family protein n=1 Tax=Lewinella sp. 4G2 TaxID=1803372 RepID=UPI0007B48B36|nr:SGNH/GDSL hydrolase family protein [Lewinella sp. 4G2]OAV44302.1 hypothetical protein A3850_007255 [Lewinella sp. 4G2]